MAPKKGVRKQTSKPDIPTGPRPSEILDIPESEQRRLIQQSELFKNAASLTTPELDRGPEADSAKAATLGDEIFNLFLLIIPFGSLLLMMDILIHQQYTQTPTFKGEVSRMTEMLPIFAILIFYTDRYKHLAFYQAFLFLISLSAGSRLIWVVNKSNYLRVMRQTPALATVWVYAVWELNLAAAVASLVVVGGWVWYTGLKMVF
ncbi:hypothetical protein SISSUDRAFT_1049320 [Sistotremastrum suecicum HHB10207 ss-3]|uniref:DUF7719 domain-containing protein n=1 Tax=Sistotremastrum suecicum HHB10207 ss-3 TaxID=1314776 RepID=A0A166BVR3_9AGAM|nr:hypothetical protein SISSUDRAFT_1049320 [Sistotremastrum suecicum HHB10207 ss-3]